MMNLINMFIRGNLFLALFLLLFTPNFIHGEEHVNCLIVKWPSLLYCYEILQSSWTRTVLEIKPSISCRLTFCATVRSEASSQGVGGEERRSFSEHSLEDSQSQNNIRKSLWCVSWPLDTVHSVSFYCHILRWKIK